MSPSNKGREDKSASVFAELAAASPGKRLASFPLGTAPRFRARRSAAWKADMPVNPAEHCRTAHAAAAPRAGQRRMSPHHFHEEHADVEVGVLLDVLDDAGLDRLASTLHLEAGGGDAGELVALQVPQPPGQDLQGNERRGDDRHHQGKERRGWLTKKPG